MRIAIVRTCSTVLSAETYNIQEIGLARALASRGHSCDVYLAGKVSAPTRHVEQFAQGGAAREIRLPAFSLPGQQGVFRGLVGLLGRGRYDLIQVHEDSQVESVRVSSWARKQGIPLVLCQGMYADHRGAAGIVLQSVFDRTFLPVLRRNTRAVSAKSLAARDYCLRKGFRNVVVNPVGLNVEVFARPAGIDWPERLGLKTNDTIVLYVGALEPRRRPDVLIESVTHVVKRRSDVVLVMIGDGPSRKAVRAFARAALGDRFRWVDRVKQAELPSLYAAAALSMVPSVFEIYGMSALESMYFGTPVIASRVGGLIDLVGGDSGGALVTSYDPSEWASVIEAVLSRGDDERRQAAHSARNRAESLRWDALRERYLAFYEEVVSESAGLRR